MEDVNSFKIQICRIRSDLPKMDFVSFSKHIQSLKKKCLAEAMVFSQSLMLLCADYDRKRS